MSDRLAAILDEIEEFLEDQEDVVDGSYGEPSPNKAMSLLRELREVRSLRSESAGIVQVLPLAPQPPTVTTSTDGPTTFVPSATAPQLERELHEAGDGDIWRAACKRLEAESAWRLAELRAIHDVLDKHGFTHQGLQLDRVIEALCEESAPSANAVAPEELARLREIEHQAWHMLDNSEERIAEDEIVVGRDDYEALSKLLSEGHPEDAPLPDRGSGQK